MGRFLFQKHDRVSHYPFMKKISSGEILRRIKGASEEILCQKIAGWILYLSLFVNFFQEIFVSKGALEFFILNYERFSWMNSPLRSFREWPRKIPSRCESLSADPFYYKVFLGNVSFWNHEDFFLQQFCIKIILPSSHDSEWALQRAFGGVLRNDLRELHNISFILKCDRMFLWGIPSSEKSRSALKLNIIGSWKFQSSFHISRNIS